MRTKSQLNILLLFFRFFRVCTRRDTICPLFFFVFFFLQFIFEIRNGFTNSVMYIHFTQYVSELSTKNILILWKQHTTTHWQCHWFIFVFSPPLKCIINYWTETCKNICWTWSIFLRLVSDNSGSGSCCSWSQLRSMVFGLYSVQNINYLFRNVFSAATFFGFSTLIVSVYNFGPLARCND